MDDIKSILANEGIKNLLQNEIKKPISFLEASLNELKLAFEEEKRKSKKLNDILYDNMGTLLIETRELKALNKELNKKLLACQEKMASMSPMEWVENELRKNNDRIAKVLSDTVEYRKMNDNRSRSNQGSLLDFAEKQKLFELDIEIIKDSLGSNMKDLNQMKATEKECRSDNDKSREDFLIEARKVLDLMVIHRDENNQKVENIYKAVQKSDKRIKQDSVDLSKDLLEKFARFEDAFEERIDDIKRNRKDVDDELGRLDQQMLGSVKSGKSSKELDDFMKQVSYNARQIAKIQNHLEGE